MELVKGRKTSRDDSRNEQKFRFPAAEEIWEVSCNEHGECEPQESRKQADLKAGLYEVAS
jgi:hypothetical protein